MLVSALTSGLEVAHDMICSSIPDTHFLLSCVRFLKRPSPLRAAQFFTIKSAGHLYVLSLTISNASLSLATGSRSGTMKDSGKVCPRARASAVLTVVEKQWSHAHSLLAQDPDEGVEEEPGSGGQWARWGGTGGWHSRASSCRPTARDARHCM